VYESLLLCHALAAYPIGDTEEVAAVYTASGARRQGFASAVVAATIADILMRGKRAVYACKKTNVASQRVAEGLGMQPLLETWEIVTG
jgi:predicted GNAT family acetyltransferase